MRADEQFVGTVDLRQLQSRPWPIMRVLAPRLAEEVELGRYVRRLLSSHRWEVVRVVPHPDGQGRPSGHVFDVYGRQAGADAHTQT